MKLLVLVAVGSACIWGQSFEGPSSPGIFPREPITASGRAKWALHATFGPVPLMTIPIQSALQTWGNSPREYGTHWDGFGKRMGSKFATTAISNTMEASLGSLWGEDPRYPRSGDGPAMGRIGHAIKMSFLAEKKSGGLMPAYARYIAIPSSRFISNEWRTPSEISPGGNAWRIGLGFATRIAGNTFNEFWPDLRRRLPHHDSTPSKGAQP